MASSIHIKHCNLWIESHFHDGLLCDKYGVDDSLSHVHDQLQIEAGNESAHEPLSHNLSQWNPMQRQILILRPLKVVLERHIDWLNSKERHWEEDGQVIL